MNRLKFRRQFLLSTFPTDQLSDWNYFNIAGRFLYAHPDLSVIQSKYAQKQLVLLGHVLDPKNHDRTTLDILEAIAQTTTENEIAKVLYGLSGRFVLIIGTKDRLLFFNDACGLRSFFYTEYQGQLQLASQPLLLKLVVGEVVSKKERYHSFYESDYGKNSKESWFPSGTSLYENVHHLVPNHYLDSATMQQVRYWPIVQHVINDYETSMDKFAELLQNTMVAGSEKYPLALGVTAGFDSRIILSASKSVKDDMQFYTLKYRDMTDKSRDIRVPAKLNKIMHFNHQVMDCQIPIDHGFAEIYQQNSDMAHLDDWGFIAYGISKNLLEGSMAIKGSCSETGRCYFYKSGKHPLINTWEEMLEYNPDWKGIPFIEERIANWFNEVKNPQVNKGYPLLDLFHWEVSVGSWQTQNQLEWDIVHDTFTPFNNRELLDTMLSIHPKYRSKPNNYKLYRDTINKLWPEVLSEPVNPPTIIEWAKIRVKSILVKLGFEKYNH